jgi:hypothetical protein
MAFIVSYWRCLSITVLYKITLSHGSTGYNGWRSNYVNFPHARPS